MNRLTDDQVADGIKIIVDGLIAAGAEPAMSDRRYVRLAEYERTGLAPDEIKQAKDAFMTTSIGDLPINSEGMRKLVDALTDEEKIKRLAGHIKLILNDIYNTGRMMQDFDYEAIFKCTRELVDQMQEWTVMQSDKAGTL